MTRAPRIDAARDPAQFYTGLIAELYDALASYRPSADEYAPFLERSGTPALELACGSGRPLIELVERGYDVDGLDASADMLERCRALARARGLSVTLHQANMQSFSLPRCYRSIFLAGGSFSLLTTDDDAGRALGCMHAHLQPGGSVLIPLTAAPVGPAARDAIEGPWAEAGDGARLRCSQIDFYESPDGRDRRVRLRYECIPRAGEPQSVEREIHTRLWSQAQFRELLDAAGFAKVTYLDPQGGRADPHAPAFVALARRGG